MLTNDPAKWIVVGTLACIQFTYWAWKKSKSPFALEKLGPGLAIAFVAGLFCILGPILLGLAPWPPVIAMVCGLALSGRQTSINLQIGWALAGASVALYFVLGTHLLASDEAYTVTRERTWEERYWDYLPDLDKDNKIKRFPSCYADSMKFGQDSGPLHLPFPKPLWHTPLTGLYSRNSHTYLIWLPGGTAKETLTGALAVPVGTPAGLERKLGFRLDTYDEADE